MERNSNHREINIDRSYVAPEIVLTQMSGPSADLWSYGCLIYQLFAGYPPFKAADEEAIFQKILTGEYDFPIVSPCPIISSRISRQMPKISVSD